MRQFFTSEAIVLSSKPTGEADKIIWLYTSKHGKMVTIAKGVKRVKSRKRAGLESFTHIKFSAVQTQGIPILTEVEIINSMDHVKHSLREASVAYFMAEVISKLAPDMEENEELFSLFVKYLNDLSTKGSLREYRLNFIQEVLQTLGFWPKGNIHPDPDKLLEEITERKLSSVRIGKKLQI